LATQNFRVKNGLEVGTGVTITSGGNITAGIVSATSFFGDGSRLSNLGSGSQWVTTSTGIHTLSKVGIGTTNPETELSIYYGVLSFAGKGTGDDRSDISIGNSTTNSAYGGDVFALNNIFIGNKVFETKTAGGAPAYNIVIGDRAGNTLGDGCQENVIIGRDAGYVNEGNANTFVGNRTGTVNKGGGGNSFYGYDAGIDNTEGDYNTFIGIGGGFAVTTGSENTLVGSYSGGSNKTGNANVAVGYVAGTGSTNSSYNIHAGSYNGGIGTGSYNVVLGSGNKGTFNNIYWFDLPSLNKSYQLAIGIRTDANPSKYWLVGNENFNVGIGTTNPTSKLTVKGNTSLETLNVSGVSTLGTVQVSPGIVTASSGIVTYYGDASRAASGRWVLGADGSSNYTFTGIGFTQTTNDPTLYLKRGEVYEFVNNSGGSHPFQIRESNGGSAYNNGVTNNGSATGTIIFEVPFNAPDTLYYQCTVHSSMGGDIIILGGGSGGTISAFSWINAL
jgi:hypothetical protein